MAWHVHPHNSCGEVQYRVTQTEPSCCAAGTGGSLTEVKEAAAWSSLLTSKVNKHWSYTSTPHPKYDLHRGWWISVNDIFMGLVFASPCIFWNLHIKSNKPESLQGPATSWEVWDSNPGRGKRYFSPLKRAVRLWSPPSFLFNENLSSFPGKKGMGR
jgi:hypothetical protein